MKRNHGIIGKDQKTTIAGTGNSSTATGMFDIHDQIGYAKDGIWPNTKKITQVQSNNVLNVFEGSSVITMTIRGTGWTSGVVGATSDLLYYSMETTAGTPDLSDADLIGGNFGGVPYITTVDGSFTLSYSSFQNDDVAQLRFKFRAEYPADTENNSFKFKVYKDSSRTELLGESVEIDIQDVAGSAAVPVYFTLRENRYGSSIGTISHYLTDTAGNIIHTFGTTSGNSGSTNWLFVDWSSNADQLSSGTQFHMAWNHAAGSSFRGDYAIDEVRLYIDGTNVETWGFESATDGQGTGGFSGFTGWRHTNQTNTTSSTTAFAVNSALAIGTGTGFGIWNVDANGTSSGGTGPTGAYQGTYYAYTETTSRFNGNHWLFSEVLQVP